MSGFKTRVIKLVRLQECHRCGQTRHKAKEDIYPALVPEDVQASVQPFHGGQCQLSNFHVCSEGCTWEHEGQTFDLVEKDFQYLKLLHHKKYDDAEQLLSIELSAEVKQAAQEAVPEPDKEWLQIDETVMLDVNHRKYKACPYACSALLESRSELVEATGNKRSGMGLKINRTLECLPDFWPSQNLMGKILKTL